MNLFENSFFLVHLGIQNQNEHTIYKALWWPIMALIHFFRTHADNSLIGNHTISPYFYIQLQTSKFYAKQISLHRVSEKSQSFEHIFKSNVLALAPRRL